MPKRFSFCALALITLVAFAGPKTAAADERQPSGTEVRFFEMRTYYAAPGKLEELHARFRNHAVRLLKKHGIENIGYWVPVENEENKLIFILAYANREAREASWKTFMADPEWQEAYKASEAQGKLVAKADSLFLQPTDYSPVVKVSGATPRLFELRTYTAAMGKLNALNKRFREHTTQLFAKHGITNIGYWVPANGASGADDTLIYIVAHSDMSAADRSWKSFRADPEWTAAKNASEVSGPLTAPNGVRSTYLRATDFSPMR
jgi:hypothetical protein